MDLDSFRPERWIEDGLEGDDKRAHVPFSARPRYCLGVNLVCMELNIILSKLVFTYDLELGSQDITSWNEACKCFGLWQKPALIVKLIPRKTGQHSRAEYFYIFIPDRDYGRLYI